MGRRMSSALRSRAAAIGLVLAIAFLALAALMPTAKAAQTGVDPAAMTVTVVLDKSSYLSGDTATAQATVYRTPAPANYTYIWRVRNFFFQLLNTTTTAGATFTYPIALDYTGTLRFEATVDDGQGTVSAGQQSATVALAYMALSLDRGDYNPPVPLVPVDRIDDCLSDPDRAGGRPAPPDAARDRGRRPPRLRERIQRRSERIPDGPGRRVGERVLVRRRRRCPDCFHLPRCRGP